MHRSIQHACSFSFPIKIPQKTWPRLTTKLRVKIREAWSYCLWVQHLQKASEATSDHIQGRNCTTGNTETNLSLPPTPVPGISPVTSGDSRLISNAVITPVVPPSGDAGYADGRCFSTGRELHCSPWHNLSWQKGSFARTAVPTPRLGV